MKDHRLRQPIQEPYATALGTAAFCFAICEWNAVWCCERMKAGSINEIKDRTAGKIHKRMKHLVSLMPSAPDHQELVDACAEFDSMVKVRNRILHGKPGAAPGNQPRLFHDGGPWEISDLEDAADAFSVCSQRLNTLAHGYLATFPGLP